MSVLITGCAGFIGGHLCHKLLESGEEVIGLDNLNDYYDPSLKISHLHRLQAFPNFRFFKVDLANRPEIAQIFASERPQRVVNLAAQAGVRYSIQNPAAYVDSNLIGFANILEGCRQSQVEHLVYASSSSVYGANTQTPFSTHHAVDHPLSLYAATKKANELMAHSYSHLYNLPTTGLRFFTVYGPWGRPDMAIFSFTKAILEGRSIQVFNHGQMKRDFTYIDDIVDGILRLLDRIPAPNPKWNSHQPDPSNSFAPYKIYNIGNNNPVELIELINTLEKCLGIEAKKEFLPIQMGDMLETYADIDDLIADVGFKPATPISEGIEKFVAWYRDFYKV
jgi:UDP-glucuronate 4-epimerase